VTGATSTTTTAKHKTPMATKLATLKKLHARPSLRSSTPQSQNQVATSAGSSASAASTTTMMTKPPLAKKQTPPTKQKPTPLSKQNLTPPKASVMKQSPQKQATPSEAQVQKLQVTPPKKHFPKKEYNTPPKANFRQLRQHSLRGGVGASGITTATLKTPPRQPAKAASSIGPTNNTPPKHPSSISSMTRNMSPAKQRMVAKYGSQPEKMEDHLPTTPSNTSIQRCNTPTSHISLASKRLAIKKMAAAMAAARDGIVSVKSNDSSVGSTKEGVVNNVANNKKGTMANNHKS